MKIKPKIVVAIPEQQHSFSLVTSLVDNGFDTTYITSVYFKEGSFLLKILKKILPEYTFKKAEKHHCDGINDKNVLIFTPVLAFIQLGLQRISTPVYRMFRKYKWKVFGKRVVSYVKKNTVDILFLYEDYSSYIVKQLHNHNVHDVKVVIDCCAASKTYMRDIYEKDNNGRNIEHYKKEYPVLWDEKEDIDQYRIADLLIVPSEFSKRSYQAVGVSADKIMKIGYPLSIEVPTKIEYHRSGKFRIVYSGQITYRKGIHHLLEAFSLLKDEYDVELFLYGSYEKTSDLYVQYCMVPGVHFMGWTLKEQMFKDFLNADLFVFPSMADSMSFSCLEAMAIGLPIVCSDNTGAADYIKNYETGIVIKTGSTDYLHETIRWCLNNRDKLKSMGCEARKQVYEYVAFKEYSLKIKDIVCRLEG